MPRLHSLLAPLLLVAVACAGGGGEAPDALPTLEPGGVVDVTPAQYEEILADLRGQPLVVNFWATWCVPCKEEMPRLVEAAHRYEGRVRFLGVNVEDGEAAARAFIREVGIPFPSVGDPSGDIRRAEGIVGMPTTQFYRTDGELAFVQNGEIDEDVLAERLEDLVRIGEPPLTPDS